MYTSPFIEAHSTMQYGTLVTGNFMQRSDPHQHSKDLFAEKSHFNRGQYFLQGQRRRLDIWSILLNLFVPWLLFCGVYVLVSFQLHFQHAALCWIIVGLCFLVGVALPVGFAATQTLRKYTNPEYQPSWALFLGFTCLVAFFTAAYSAQYNFMHFMRPYYEYLNLASYTDLDTNEYVGQQLMDAGRITFVNGTQLDLTHSMGFRNTNMFCVAPIFTKNSTFKTKSLDFWAVGKDCCSGNQADFHCRGFANPRSGALRLINEWDRPFYRLAVQQAEATYKITAAHPLFFEWVPDVEETLLSFAQTGYKNCLIWCISAFLLQAFLTVSSSLAFAKLIHA